MYSCKSKQMYSLTLGTELSVLFQTSYLKLKMMTVRWRHLEPRKTNCYIEQIKNSIIS